MLKIVQIVSDMMLTMLVPHAEAHAACTPAERQCICEGGDYSYTLCWWEQLCNGQYRQWDYRVVHAGC